MDKSVRESVGAAAASRRKPNFVLINCDDLGYGDLSCYGSETIATPNLDELARNGVLFTDFYAPAPMCSPSRAGLLTGRYAARSGIIRVLFPQDTVGIADDDTTLAELLKEQGYATACIAKWHLGCLPEHYPTRHGFDYFYGILYSNDMHEMKGEYNDTPLMRQEEVIEQPAVQSTLTERYTQEAIDFIREHKDEPFFVYIPHTMPHVPLYVSERFAGKSKGGLYGDVVETIDWGLGEIMKALAELGLEKNTLVMFTSDNGPWLQKKELGGSAGPLREGKGSPYEGGFRIPMIAHWPGRIAAGSVCKAPGSHLDYLPTLVSLAGGDIPEGRLIDGRDITPLLDGGSMPDYEWFYTRFNDIKAVRFGKWKLVVGQEREDLPEPELYDLEQDIGEEHDVAGRHPDIVAKLRKAIEDFRQRLPEVDMPPRP